MSVGKVKAQLPPDLPRRPVDGSVAVKLRRTTLQTLHGFSRHPFEIAPKLVFLLIEWNTDAIILPSIIL